MLKKCESLYGYSFFINKIREYQTQGLTLEEVITPVIEYCIKNNILKEYLEAHASEVINMIFGEYDRDMDIAVNRREAKEEGRAEGLEEGRKEKLIIAKNLLSEGSTPEFVHRITGLSLEEIKGIQ
jgi:predicted transposase/invertase (TIGR01784 family)